MSTTIPANILEGRRKVSERYLSGSGIEIGALHCPLPLPSGAKVRYLDRMNAANLRRHYRELKDFPLVPVDIIDDGERLETIPDRQLEFLIASHMLEHCENPLGTIRCHLSKVRRGGIIYYGVPDKRLSFDCDRPLTAFEHLVLDDKEGSGRSRWSHYLEYSTLVHKISDAAAAEADARHLMKANYSIHFHVWDFDSFKHFIAKANSYLNFAFAIKLIEQNEAEIIAVLKRF